MSKKENHKDAMELNEEVQESIHALEPSEDLDENDENEEKKEKKSSKTLLYIVIAILVLSVIGNGWQFYHNRKLRKKAKDAIAKVEEYQNENIMLEEQIASLSLQNQENERDLDNAYQKNADKDVVIANLKQENETLGQIRDEVAKIEDIRKNLNKNLDQITVSKQKLRDVQNSVNKTITDKQRKNNAKMKSSK